MIITKTPFRISFFGGGTDISDFFNKYMGSVISTSFNKYCYVTVRHLPPFFDYSSECVYSKIERVRTVQDIEHPLIRNAMIFCDMNKLRITYEADLPARTGLGTSSSFAVGLINAFSILNSKPLDKRKIAETAIHIEREMCNEEGGWQDQIAASFGGFNRINFKNNAFEVIPIHISEFRKNKLNDNLLLFYTGISRFSSEIQKSTIKTISNKEKELTELLALVDDAQEILEDENKNIDDFGKLLDKTWKLKKSTGSNITSEYINSLYDRGISAGALGGKLLGAGGGGFLLFYVTKERQDEVKKALNNLLFVPFKFENNGTQVIYYTPEFYDHKEEREDK